MTVRDALVQLKALLLTATAAGQPALTAGYVLPDDYALLPGAPACPFLAVGELYNTPNDWQRKASGLALHKWRARGLGRPAPGPPAAPNARAAAAVRTPRELARAMRRLFQYGIGHVYLDETNVYWGLRLELAIQQTHAQAMTA